MSLNAEILEQDQQPTEPKTKKKWSKKKIYNFVLGIFLTFVAILFSLTIYSTLSYQTGFFSDLSMSPTINKTITNNGIQYNNKNFSDVDDNIVEYGTINHKISTSALKRFDVVVLTNNAASFDFNAIRVIGLPGETVKLDYYGKLYINGELVNQPIPEEYLKLNWSDEDDKEPSELNFECTLNDGEFYLLKDNRYYTRGDSRIVGAYKAKQIYGKVISVDGTCTISGGKCINRSIPFPRFI